MQMIHFKRLMVQCVTSDHKPETQKNKRLIHKTTVFCYPSKPQPTFTVVFSSKVTEKLTLILCHRLWGTEMWGLKKAWEAAAEVPWFTLCWETSGSGELTMGNSCTGGCEVSGGIEVVRCRSHTRLMTQMNQASSSCFPYTAMELLGLLTRSRAVPHYDLSGDTSLGPNQAELFTPVDDTLHTKLGKAIWGIQDVGHFMVSQVLAL